MVIPVWTRVNSHEREDEPGQQVVREGEGGYTC
jgi:hypothetical protein